MQTFVPYPDFIESAVVLDRQRLGKQRVEVIQILNTLAGISAGWANHPAVLMWKDHEYSLMKYGVEICQEWLRRGYRDTCLLKISNIYNENFYYTSNLEDPHWLGGPIHVTHQSKLIQKFPDHYRPLFVGVRDDLDYYWPTQN